MEPAFLRRTRYYITRFFVPVGHMSMYQDLVRSKVERRGYTGLYKAKKGVSSAERLNSMGAT